MLVGPKIGDGSVYTFFCVMRYGRMAQQNVNKGLEDTSMQKFPFCLLIIC